MSLTESSICVGSGQFARTLTDGNQGLKNQAPKQLFDHRLGRW